MIGNDELDRLEHSVQAALRTGRAEGLGLLGAGEISLVLGLPAAHPTWACKRLPPFPSPRPPTGTSLPCIDISMH